MATRLIIKPNCSDSYVETSTEVGGGIEEMCRSRIKVSIKTHQGVTNERKRMPSRSTGCLDENLFPSTITIHTLLK